MRVLLAGGRDLCVQDGTQCGGASSIGLADNRAPPPLLAAGGRLTINGLMVLKHLFAADLGQTPLRFTPYFDCEDKKIPSAKFF